ncbi:MAG: CHAD domain-containing protein [Kiritimatiellae bacterium]|jgi:hypothetical protein|nr:CHAD domain-containing protein [Kiritimatiellia bacterium]
MPYRLKTDETVQNGVRRIADEQIERALTELQNTDLSSSAIIHQVRKRSKKVRALLRLVRLALKERYSQENARYRDAARSLSAVRDVTAMIETYDALYRLYAKEVDGQVIAPIRRYLTARQQVVMADDALVEERLQAFGRTLIDGRGSTAVWTLSDDGFAAVAGGLRKTYRRARTAMRIAYEECAPTPFHEWRKRVKYHWYHLRLLREIWPVAIGARRNEADHLGAMLGDHHNLSLLRDLLLDESDCSLKEEAIGTFIGLIDHRLSELQTRCKPLGKRLFAEKPTQMLERFAHYWSATPGF